MCKRFYHVIIITCNVTGVKLPFFIIYLLQNLILSKIVITVPTPVIISRVFIGVTSLSSQHRKATTRQPIILPKILVIVKQCSRTSVTITVTPYIIRLVFESNPMLRVRNNGIMPALAALRISILIMRIPTAEMTNANGMAAMPARAPAVLLETLSDALSCLLKKYLSSCCKVWLRPGRCNIDVLFRQDTCLSQLVRIFHDSSVPPFLVLRNAIKKIRILGTKKPHLLFLREMWSNM